MGRPSTRGCSGSRSRSGSARSPTFCASLRRRTSPTASGSPVAGSDGLHEQRKLLFVDHRAALDFEAGSEAAAALATGTPEALARLYAGTDAAGFVSTLGRRTFRRPLTQKSRRSTKPSFRWGDALRRRFRERRGARRPRDAAVATLSLPLGARARGRAARRLRGRVEAARSGCSAPRRATRCSTPPPRASSTRPTGSRAWRARCSSDTAAVDVMRDFHGQAYHLEPLRDDRKARHARVRRGSEDGARGSFVSILRSRLRSRAGACAKS